MLCKLLYNKYVNDIHKVNPPLSLAPRSKKENIIRTSGLSCCTFLIITCPRSMTSNTLKELHLFLKRILKESYSWYSFVHGLFCPALLVRFIHVVARNNSLFIFVALYSASMHKHCHSIFNPLCC